MRRVGRKATTACCFISFFGYKSVVAVHRRGVPNDIRREKNFPFYILQYENDSLDLPMSWDSRTLDSPVVRANHFYLFLIFRIFSNFEKIRKETFTHRILCGGCSTCANKAATNVCVCVYNKTRKKFNPLAFFCLLVSSRKFKKKTKKQKREKVVEGQLE